MPAIGGQERSHARDHCCPLRMVELSSTNALTNSAGQHTWRKPFGKTEEFMRLNIVTRKNATMITIAALGIFFVPNAHACGELPGKKGFATFGLTPSSFASQPSFSLSAGPLESSATEDQRAAGRRYTSIVGMWVVGFYHGTNRWDLAIEQFSPDGNEMTNDNAYPPAQGNICWGVWEHVGKGRYQMRHIGWVWNANGVYFGRFDFAATIVLNDRGNGFTGNYVADQEDVSGNILPEFHDAGTLKATRF
jgi:hypothetical protein